MKASKNPRVSDPPRSRLLRAAHKWYSWAGLTLTITGAYFAGSGQIKFGDTAQLRAAPPEIVQWKAASSGPDLGKPTGPNLSAPTPTINPNDPFKPAVTPSTKSGSVPVPVGATLPDVVVAPKPTVNKRVGATLDAYLNNTEIKPVAFEVVEPVKELPMPMVAPSIPSVPKTVEVPATPKPLEIPSVSTEGKLPLPQTVPPVGLPPLPANKPASTGAGAQLPVPSGKPGDGSAKPVSNSQNKPGMLPLGMSLPQPVAQQPEIFPGKPTPVDPKDTKSDTPPRRNLLGTLTPEDEILLNAAANAAKLKDFQRAAELYGKLIAKYPKEYDIRAEYAGMLLGAGEFQRAIRELEQVLSVNEAKRNAVYWIRLGDAYMIVRQYRAAASSFMAALELIQNDKNEKIRAKTPEAAIRLARAFALDNDLQRAGQIFDRYISGMKPDDDRTPLAVGPLLLDLDRPNEALAYLLAKRKQLLREGPSETNAEEFDLKMLEVLASMVRGFARVGERHQAMEAVNEMAPRAPMQTGIRAALGDILFQIDEFEIAGHVFNQVLSVDPANGTALIGIARVHLEMLQPASAKRILDSFIPNRDNMRAYLMTYSSYHQTVGEYTEAKHIYKQLLSRNPYDNDVRYALGRLYDYTKEWEKAKAEFAKIPAGDKNARRARLWFGNTLFHQRKFAEAAQVGDVLLREDPNNADAVALVTRALAKMGQHERGIAQARAYLATSPKDDKSVATVRIAIGRALLDANKPLEAAREYEIALSKPAGRVPEAYYGLARAAEKLNQPEKAAQVISTLVSGTGADLRAKIAIADQYSQDFEYTKVLEITQGLVGTDNGANLAVLIRLADAQQIASRWPGEPADCFATCQTILRQSPTNVRAHLAMSRSFAIAQNFRKASVQYDQLIAIDPEFTIPPRERARVLYSDHQYSAARSQYNAVLSPTPEEVVLTQMAGYVARDPKFKNAFGAYLAGAGGGNLRAELARIANPNGDEVAQAAHHLVCDYDATMAWQEPFRLERDAKELKDYRNYEAIGPYQTINAFEPTNTETLFDLGQVYGSLRQTRNALTWYSNCLVVDPTHRESIAASERATAEISPKFDGRSEFFRQRGRSGVASIDRIRHTAAGSIPLGDENEFLQIGYSRINLRPLDDSDIWGNIPFARIQKRWGDDGRLMTWGQVNVEQYESRISTRPTFDAGYWYDHSDFVRSHAGVFLENVLECGESLRQDIYRYGAYAGLDFKASRTWAFGGRYTYAHYSDNNDMHQGFLYNEVALTLPPKMLKLAQRLNYWDYREETIFPTVPLDPDNLFGAIHPYFAPKNFAIGEVRVEWWHWLSRDYFVHSNQCYYSLQYGISSDTNLITYHDFRFLANYDVNSWLTFGMEARAFVSTEYKLYAATGFLQVRFPGR